MGKNCFVVLLVSFMLVSCTKINYNIDKNSYRAIGKNSRIKFIILHYTATSDEGGLKTLTTENVSAHYLITSKDKDPIYNLVDEHERAWHAGISKFKDRSNINDTSIGIEITNLGVKPNSDGYGFFIPYDNYIEYSEGQIKKIAFLLQYLIKKYNIKPKDILGHSDIAPLRKIDPGAKFPWERLYKEYGIGVWYRERDKKFFMNPRVFKRTPIKMIKEELRKFGYNINSSEEWDEESKRIVYNFQAHFNPKKATGQMDLESYAILKALNKRYK